MINRLEYQDILEKEAYEIKKGKYYAALVKQGAEDSPVTGGVIRSLIGDVNTQISEWLSATNDPQHRGVKHGTVGHLLITCEADTLELSVLTLRVALRTLQRNSAYGSACVALGGFVEEHLGWDAADSDPEHKKYIRAVSKSLKKSTSEHHSRAVVRHVLRKRGMSLDWDDKLRAQVGLALFERMFVASNHFTKVKVGRMTRQRVYIRTSDTLAKALMEEHEAALLFKPFHIPMVAEPKPWTSTGDGGYNDVQLEVMKKYAGDQRDRMGLTVMKDVYQAMNKLQRTKWRVNADIFFLMRRCWRDGDQVGKLPPQENMPTPAKTWTEGSLIVDATELTNWKRAAAKVHEDNARLVSKRLAMSQKLYLAGKMMRAFDWVVETDEDGEQLAPGRLGEVGNPDRSFHFVYTMDWRGRVYPSGGDLTPQADDAGRALLEFSEGKPISDAGFYWLAVQLANTYGHDKVSNRHRVKWVLEHEGGIIASALEPLHGHDPLWQGADKPWSFLAAAMEWTAARAVGPTYVTHLPVAQDGSANGLQHFAALMRDQESAQAVNLTAATTPPTSTSGWPTRQPSCWPRWATPTTVRYSGTASTGTARSTGAS